MREKADCICFALWNELLHWNVGIFPSILTGMRSQGGEVSDCSLPDPQSTKSPPHGPPSLLLLLLLLLLLVLDLLLLLPPGPCPCHAKSAVRLDFSLWFATCNITVHLKGSVCSVQCEGYEVCSKNCVVWSTQHEVCTSSVKSAMLSMLSEGLSMQCEVWSVHCKEHNVKCSVKCAV